MIKIARTYASDDYIITEFGMVISLKTGKRMKEYINYKGYPCVSLWVNGKDKGCQIHVLLGRAFIDGYKEGLVINHINGDKTDYSLSNLEWVTPQYNAWHSIHVLGNDNKGKLNPNAHPVYSISKNGEIRYYDTMIDAAKCFYSGDDYKKLSGIVGVISSVVHGRKKTYRGNKFILKQNLYKDIDDIELYQKTIRKYFENTYRPQKDELEFMITKYPFVKIAQIYGVTDSAVRKWCKNFNLPFKKNDIRQMPLCS